jgi:hypothetical protein
MDGDAILRDLIPTLFHEVVKARGDDFSIQAFWSVWPNAGLNLLSDLLLRSNPMEYGFSD